jgi:OmpA-OmpF porin, OOP family
MKRSLMALAVGATSALCAFPAAAQFQPQFYVGAGGGWVDSDDSSNAWKIYGGAQFNPYLGVEGAYNDLGDVGLGDLTSWTLSAVGTWPINPAWSVFAKLGAAWSDIENGGKHDSTEMLIGAGVDFNFNKNLGVRVEYEDFGDTPDIAGRDASVSVWSLSVKYRF